MSRVSRKTKRKEENWEKNFIFLSNAGQNIAELWFEPECDCVIWFIPSYKRMTDIRVTDDHAYFSCRGMLSRRKDVERERERNGEKQIKSYEKEKERKSRRRTMTTWTGTNMEMKKNKRKKKLLSFVRSFRRKSVADGLIISSVCWLMMERNKIVERNEKREIAWRPNRGSNPGHCG